MQAGDRHRADGSAAAFVEARKQNFRRSRLLLLLWGAAASPYQVEYARPAISLPR
jgi:hypothetical protein